jgi:hypothetical protein
MGMAMPPLITPPRLIADNLVICKQCEAQYDPSLDWIWARSKGTSTRYRQVMNIPEGRCPVCLSVHEIDVYV